VSGTSQSFLNLRAAWRCATAFRFTVALTQRRLVRKKLSVGTRLLTAGRSGVIGAAREPELRQKSDTKASPFGAGIQRRKLGSWPSASAEAARLRLPEFLFCDVECGMPAPMSGQLDNIRRPATLSEHPSSEVVGRLRTSTSESSRAKERGRSDTTAERRSLRSVLPEDRNTGGLALPVGGRASIHEPETPNEPACGAVRKMLCIFRDDERAKLSRTTGRWKSPSLRPRRMSR
jgi:hypothetical protein